jgi:hypothetical protein
MAATKLIIPEQLETAHAAIDLAKYGSWEPLFRLLEEHESFGCGALVNTRPSPREYGILHQASWHGNAKVCETLVNKYHADPALLSRDGQKAAEVASGRGFTQLVETLRNLEESGPEAFLIISVVLPSGCMLIEGQSFRASERVSSIVQLAQKYLADKGQEGNVSALCTTDGRRLDHSLSLLRAALGDESILTAVISDDETCLNTIQSHFHGLIMQISGCEASELEGKGFVFPSLQEHVRVFADVENYYAVPGMYGGFNTSVRKGSDGWVLRCESWCRICDGSEQTHEITVAGVQKLHGY